MNDYIDNLYKILKYQLLWGIIYILIGIIALMVVILKRDNIKKPYVFIALAAVCAIGLIVVVLVNIIPTIKDCREKNFVKISNVWMAAGGNLLPSG